MPSRNKMTTNGRRQRRSTTAVIRRRRTPPLVIRRRRPPTTIRRRRPKHQTIRQQLRGAARLHIDVKLHNGLQAKLDIGPAWLGMMLSALVASWWPELLPLIQPLLKLLG